MFDTSLNAEIVNKLFHLNKSLDEARKSINSLKQENSCLKDALANLASINKKDYEYCIEDIGDSIISA